MFWSVISIFTWCYLLYSDIDPAEFKQNAFLRSYDLSPLVPIVFWLTWSILIDYVSLFKTRIILRLFAGMRRINAAAAVPIMVVDYGIYVVIFSIGVVFLTLGMMAAERIAMGGRISATT